MITCKIKKITKGYRKTNVYDIIGINDNHNFVANNVVIHNCDESIRFATSEDWAKCLSGNTVIKTNNGNIKIKDLINKKNFLLYTYNEKTKKEELQIAEECIKTKVDYVYELETEDGNKIKCTKEHKFLTKNGWKELQELNDGDEIIGI